MPRGGPGPRLTSEPRRSIFRATHSSRELRVGSVIKKRRKKMRKHKKRKLLKRSRHKKR
jgi:hypothetical protein